MAWLKARLREPSTWSAISLFLVAAAFFLMTRVGWWRDLTYLAAGCAVVAAVMTEKGGK